MLELHFSDLYLELIGNEKSQTPDIILNQNL